MLTYLSKLKKLLLKAFGNCSKLFPLLYLQKMLYLKFLKQNF